MGTQNDVAEIAEQVCGWFAQGDRSGHTIGRIHFELSDIARCSEFVRECNEAAAGTADHGPLSWRYFGGTARETEQKLQAEGRAITAPQRGAIVCFNKGAAGPWGHIGVCLGDGKFAENTSSRRRGPGFVTSRLADMAGRVSGYYSILPAAEEEVLKVVLLPGSDVISCRPEIEGGVTRCDLRAVAEALGYEVIAEHIPGQNKIYLTEATK